MSQVAVTILEKRMAEMVTDLIDTFLIRGEKVVPQNIRMNRLKFWRRKIRNKKEKILRKFPTITLSNFNKKIKSVFLLQKKPNFSSSWLHNIN